MCTYLETHVSLLTWSDVFSSLGDLDDTDIIIMTSEKLLSSWNNMSNDERSSKGVDNMFIIWVQNESISDLSLKSDDGLKFKFLFHYSYLFVCFFENMW
jgi:hypothetical protein